MKPKKRLPVGDLRAVAGRRRLIMEKSGLPEGETTPSVAFAKLEKAYLNSFFPNDAWAGRVLIKHFGEAPLLPSEQWSPKILQEGLYNMRRYLIKNRKAKTKAEADNLIKAKLAELIDKTKRLNGDAARQRYGKQLEALGDLRLSRANHFLIYCNSLIGSYAQEMMFYMGQKRR